MARRATPLELVAPRGAKTPEGAQEGANLRLVRGVIVGDGPAPGLGLEGVLVPTPRDPLQRKGATERVHLVAHVQRESVDTTLYDIGVYTLDRLLQKPDCTP